MIDTVQEFKSGRLCRPHRECRVENISLTIETGNRKIMSLLSPFLNGKITANGQFCEVCLPNSSKLRKGIHGLLRISEAELAYAVILIDLKDISHPSPKLRHYIWEYGVIGVARDKTRIFPIDDDREFLGVDDLLTLIGGTREQLGGGVFLNSEGGFTLDESLGRFSE